MLGMFQKKVIKLQSPIPGRIVDLIEVPDQVFAEKMMGDGFAVIPSRGSVVSPFDGEVVMVFRTKHAVGLRSKEGLELLIHVGLDTVELNGEGFVAKVKDGDKIKIGDVLLEFDMDYIKQHGKDLISPIIITNMDRIKSLEMQKEGAPFAALVTLR